MDVPQKRRSEVEFDMPNKETVTTILMLSKIKVDMIAHLQNSNNRDIPVEEEQKATIQSDKELPNFRCFLLHFSIKFKNKL